MAQTLHNLMFHTIFSTKNRRPLIEREFEEELHRYMGGIIRNHGGQPIQIGGIEDHIHVLMSLRTDQPLAKMMNFIKTGSSLWVKEKHGIHDFGWQNGYCGVTVSASVKQPLIRYIQRQHEHHKTQTFMNEMSLQIEKNEIDCDEQYLWN